MMLLMTMESHIQPSYMHMIIEDHLLPGEKAELRFFTSSGSRKIRNWGILVQTTQNNAIVRMTE